jgi:hypothetical protein
MAGVLGAWFLMSFGIGRRLEQHIILIPLLLLTV